MKAIKPNGIIMDKDGWKSVYDRKEMVDWYEKRAQIVSMNRDELDSVIISVLPYGKEENIRILELGSGTGNLTEKILQSFPHANITCLDGALGLINAAKARLQHYGGRITFVRGDLENPSWNTSLGDYHVIASARTIHHLHDERKKTLFKQVFDMLVNEGCFVNGDLVKSKYEILNKKYFDDIWANYIKKKTKEILGIDRSINEVIRKMREASAKEGDKPATVEDQLKWLQEAGFATADCVWKYYFIAIVVGFK